MDVLVQNIRPETSKERIRLFFGNPKRGGVLKIKQFDEVAGEAVIAFENPADAERTIQTREFQLRKNEVLTVSSFPKMKTKATSQDRRNTHSEKVHSDDAHTVLLQGFPSTVTEMLVYDLLEDVAEITEKSVTNIQICKHKGTALVTMREKEVAEMLLKQPDEVMNGYTITFLLPSAEVEQKQPVSRTKNSPRQKTTDQIGDQPSSENNSVEKITNTIGTSGNVSDRAKSFSQESSEKLPSRTTRLQSEKSLHKVPSVSSASEATADACNPSERVPLHPKPQKRDLSRFTSMEKSDDNKPERKPIRHHQATLAIPEGLQDIVANLGQRRISKKVPDAVEAFDEKGGVPETETESERQPLLSPKVLQQLTSKLKHQAGGSSPEEDQHSADDDSI